MQHEIGLLASARQLSGADRFDNRVIRQQIDQDSPAIRAALHVPAHAGLIARTELSQEQPLQNGAIGARQGGRHSALPHGNDSGKTEKSIPQRFVEKKCPAKRCRLYFLLL
jgi:hypothetical protein